MTRLKCIVTDDELPALNLLVRYVNETPYLELAGSFDNALDALEFIQNESIDLALLDIEMPEINGLELARKLPESTKVIFTTAYENFALEGFRVNALDYLLKPISLEEFSSAAQKVREWFDLKNRQHTGTQQYMFVKTGYKLLKVDFEDILFIEGLRDYVRFYLRSTDKSVMSLMAMKTLEVVLPAEQFMRVHRSYIVRLDAITSIEKGQIIIDSHKITIAAPYKDAFRSFLSSSFLK